MITVNRRIVPTQTAVSTETIWFRVLSVKLFNYFTLFRINEQLTDPRPKPAACPIEPVKTGLEPIARTDGLPPIPQPK